MTTALRVSVETSLNAAPRRRTTSTLLGLEWTPDSGPREESSLDRPSLFAALQKLGFKMEPTRGSVEIIVIDHAEKPTGN